MADLGALCSDSKEPEVLDVGSLWIFGDDLASLWNQVPGRLEGVSPTYCVKGRAVTTTQNASQYVWPRVSAQGESVGLNYRLPLTASLSLGRSSPGCLQTSSSLEREWEYDFFYFLKLPAAW